MAPDLKQNPRLIQKPILDQRLIMTPQLQQAIKLLQLSRRELIETINQEIEENPALDEQDIDLPEVNVEERVRDDIDWDNYPSEYNSSWTLWGTILK